MSIRTRTRLLEQATTQQLRAMVNDLGVPGVDRRSARRMIDALTLQRSASTNWIRQHVGEVGPGAPPHPPSRSRTFVAIDFETANQDRFSACALGMVRVEGASMVERRRWLIRPPSMSFEFTHIHGITWGQVAGSPAFSEVWQEALPMLEGADYLAAHNAGFDRSVLMACCQQARLHPPPLPFLNTVTVARRTWALQSHGLAEVCRHLRIELGAHHDALCDAEACANIVIQARSKAGLAWKPEVFLSY